MIALLLVAQLTTGVINPTPHGAQFVLTQASMCTAAPIFPTAEVRGDSLMQGGSCAGNVTTPVIYLNTNLPGGVGSGYVVAMNAKTGDTGALISTAYFSGPTSGTVAPFNESYGCLGKRCKVLFLNGCTNSLRVGVTPQACHDTMYAIVLDALSKGRYVVWVNVPPYGAYSGAGTNPLGQATGYNTLQKASCDAIINDSSNPYSKRLRCVDAYTPFVNPSIAGNMKPECTCDGVHFLEACSNQYMGIILTAFLSML